MTLFNLMGLVSTAALALPLILLIVTKLAWYRSFPALFFYYLFVLSFNFLLLGYIRVDGNFRYYLGVTCNLVDTPLMLSFLLYFSKTIAFRKRRIQEAPYDIPHVRSRSRRGQDQTTSHDEQQRFAGFLHGRVAAPVNQAET